MKRWFVHVPPAIIVLVAVFSIGWLLHRSYEVDKYNQQHPTCKVCHCGLTLCSRECSEESMCSMRCESQCKRVKPVNFAPTVQAQPLPAPVEGDDVIISIPPTSSSAAHDPIVKA